MVVQFSEKYDVVPTYFIWVLPFDHKSYKTIVRNVSSSRENKFNKDGTRKEIKQV